MACSTKTINIRGSANETTLFASQLDCSVFLRCSLLLSFCGTAEQSKSADENKNIDFNIFSFFLLKYSMIM